MAATRFRSSCFALWDPTFSFLRDLFGGEVSRGSIFEMVDIFGAIEENVEGGRDGESREDIGRSKAGYRIPYIIQRTSDVIQKLPLRDGVTSRICICSLAEYVRII